jgi:hypothetical protein
MLEYVSAIAWQRFFALVAEHAFHKLYPVVGLSAKNLDKASGLFSRKN